MRSRQISRRHGPFAARLGRFRRDESGSLIVFTLFLLICVFMVAGVAVDAVRFEAQRTRLQNTLDRAVLAAADMSNDMDSDEVVEGYFDKAGLMDFLASVTETSTLNSKTVAATGSGSMDTFFMKMVGITELEPAAAGTAEESISDIEISLVLDISNSMNEFIYETVVVTNQYGSTTYRNNTGRTKIEALKSAANEFVDTIFASTLTGSTSVSIVPYDSQVNVGATLLSHYTVTTAHTLNNCVNFDDADFDSTAISQTATLQRADHLDVWYRSRPPTLTVCRTSASTEILPLADDPDDIETYINGLVANGNTSVDLGMKWGTALLDPGSQDVVSELIDDGHVSEEFEGRPYAYGGNDAMKVIVVMTDGKNTSQFVLNSAYKTANSGVWLWTSGGVDYYSVYYPEGSGTSRDGDSTRNELYWHMSQCTRIGCGSSGSLNTAKYQNTPHGGAAAVQLTYQQLWAKMSIDFHAYNLRYAVRGSSSDYYAWDNEPYTSISPTTKDARMNDICTAAKDAGIIVFAIAFEVTEEDAAKLEGCASSAAHFYDVDGLEITTAFQSIANAIGKLRLTQ